MDFPLFPNEYKRQRDIRVEQEIQEEKSKVDELKKEQSDQ